MRLAITPSHLLWLVSWGALTACANTATPHGGQTGDGSDFQDPRRGDDGDDGEEDAEGDAVNDDLGAGCEYESEAVDGLDVATGLGFTAAELLAVSMGPFDSELRWLGEGNVAPAVTGLRLEFDYDGGAIEVLRAIEPSSGDGILLTGNEESCPDLLAVGARAHIETEDGTLDETVSVDLRAATLELTTFSGRLPADDLNSSLAFEPEYGTLSELAFVGLVSSFGTRGAIHASFTYGEADGERTDDSADVAASQLTIAIWPATESCQPRGDEPSSFGAGLPVDASADMGPLDVEDAIERIEQSLPATLRWADGSVTQWDLSVAPTGPVCAFPDFNGRFSISSEAMVMSSTRDGQFASELIGTLALRPSSSGEFASSRVSVRVDGMSAAQAIEQFGLNDVDLTDASSVNLSLYFGINEAGAQEGELDLTAIGPLPDCKEAEPTDPRDTGGEPDEPPPDDPAESSSTSTSPEATPPGDASGESGGANGCPGPEYTTVLDGTVE